MSRTGKHRIRTVFLTISQLISPLLSIARKIGDIQWCGYLASTAIVNPRKKYMSYAQNADNTKNMHMERHNENITVGYAFPWMHLLADF